MNNNISAEIQRQRKGHNHNSLTINIDDLGHTIMFKSGGNATSPVSVKAAAGGGIYSEGIFEPWEIEGTVIVNKSLAKWLLKIYQEKNFSPITSALLQNYSATSDIIMKHRFSNARISKILDFAPQEFGGKVEMKIAFSLNDLESSEIS